MKRRALLTAIATSGAVTVADCGMRGRSCDPPTDTFDRPRDRWPTAGYSPMNTAHAPSGPSSGKIQWQTDREAGEGPRLNGVFSAPIVYDGAVCVALRQLDAYELDEPGYLVALNDDTGELQWRVELPSMAGGDPALAGDTIIIGDDEGDSLTMTLREAYEAYRDGDLTEAEVRDIIGNNWEDAEQLARVEDIIKNQPEPDDGIDNLFR